VPDALRGAPSQNRQSEFATELNVLERFVPTVDTAPMMMTATSAAISPYSIAVTPDASAANRDINFLMGHLPLFERSVPRHALKYRFAIYLNFHQRTIGSPGIPETIKSDTTGVIRGHVAGAAKAKRAGERNRISIVPSLTNENHTAKKGLRGRFPEGEFR
jgi:hypothetical protein